MLILMKKPKKGVFLVSALAVFLFGAIYWFNTSQFIQRGTLLNEVYANIGDSEEYTLLDTDSQPVSYTHLTLPTTPNV